MAWLAKNPEVVVTELEDGAVLLNMETRRYYSLNDSGLEIWRRIGAAASEQELAANLSGLFEAEESRVQAAVAGFVPELERERLVVSATESEPASAWPQTDGTKALAEPELVLHDEPLHEVPSSPFDPQLPLAE
jgi:hypothetical protein